MKWSASVGMDVDMTAWVSSYYLVIQLEAASVLNKYGLIALNRQSHS